MPRTCDSQIHPLGERAQDRCERAAVLYEPAAVLSRLPQDLSALAQALSKEPQALFTLAEALSNEAQVRYPRGEVRCEDTHDRIFAVEVLGKTHPRRRELAPSRETLS